MTRYAATERQALCDTLLAVGPGAPTLCHPWRSNELAAHLVLRETRPDLTLGQFVRPLKGRLDRALHERAQGPYAELVATLRGGPPRWTPAALPPVDEAMNLVEFFVHHEDVRRAAPEWAPRTLDPGYERALWGALKRMSRLLYRRVPVGVTLAATGYGQHEAKGGGDQGSVGVAGRVAELLLYSQGRRSAASVTLTGSDKAIAALQAADLSV